VKYLYNENKKKKRKKLRNTQKAEYILCSWIGRINIGKMSILPRAYRYNAIPIKIPTFFTEPENKIYMERQIPLTAKAKKKE
jgi:hypothetical protein